MCEHKMACWLLNCGSEVQTWSDLTSLGDKRARLHTRWARVHTSVKMSNTSHKTSPKMNKRDKLQPRCTRIHTRLQPRWARVYTRLHPTNLSRDLKTNFTQTAQHRINQNNYYPNSESSEKVKLTSPLYCLSSTPLCLSLSLLLLLLLRWKTRLRLLLWRDLSFETTSCLNSIRLPPPPRLRSNKSYLLGTLNHSLW